MSAERFAELDEKLSNGDRSAAIDYLIDRFRAERNHPALFEARLMKARLDLGLPLIQLDDSSSFPEGPRREYERFFLEAAREVGEAFLADGKIDRAWPYFRALGQTEPVKKAIEEAAANLPEDADPEPIIAIAYQEGVYPSKGLELILKHHGMCRAITAFGMYGVPNGRSECIQLLVEALHREVVERLKRAIASAEGAEPATSSIPELIANRDYLFGEYDYYVDSSHLGSVLQYAIELPDDATLRLAYDLSQYGRRLSPHFQSRGNPPFDDVYLDHGRYLGALLGIETEEAIAAFQEKARNADPDLDGTVPAQVLVRLLLRLNRHHEALEVAVEHFKDRHPSDLGVPSALQICRLAGDYPRLMELAREKGDLLSYVAAGLEKAST